MEDGTNESDEELPLGPIAELKFYDEDQCRNMCTNKNL